MRRSFVSVCLAVAAAIGVAQAEDAKVGGITVSEVWARATPPSARNGAAFLTLRNAGGADSLVAAASPVAKRVGIHESSMKDGVMRMREVSGVAVPAGGTAKLEPGGLHVMLMGLDKPLKADESFPLTLTFAKAGKVTVDVVVQKIGARGMSHGDGHNMKKEMKKE